MDMVATTNRNIYGTQENAGLVDARSYHDNRMKNHAGSVDWADKRLAKITRLRLLSDPGFPAWDVSYCHGILKDGRECDVILPFHQLPKRNMWGEIFACGRQDGVYVKGILDKSAISTLC
jgi:hypothetical protein